MSSAAHVRPFVLPAWVSTILRTWNPGWITHVASGSCQIHPDKACRRPSLACRGGPRLPPLAVALDNRAKQPAQKFFAVSFLVFWVAAFVDPYDGCPCVGGVPRLVVVRVAGVVLGWLS